jgi:hypothetical protein
LGIDSFNNFDALIRRLKHITMVLYANDYSMLFAKSGAFPETFNHPYANGIPFVFIPFGDFACK